MPEAPITEMKLTKVFTSEVRGHLNIRAGGTYCVLVEAILSPEAEKYLSSLATPLLAAHERTTYGTTDLEMYGQAIASRLRHANNPLAEEILEVLQGQDPKTWFTRVMKP
jgi:hypothetical protein